MDGVSMPKVMDAGNAAVLHPDAGPAEQQVQGAAKARPRTAVNAMEPTDQQGVLAPVGNPAPGHQVCFHLPGPIQGEGHQAGFVELGFPDEGELPMSVREIA